MYPWEFKQTVTQTKLWIQTHVPAIPSYESQCFLSLLYQLTLYISLCSLCIWFYVVHPQARGATHTNLWTCMKLQVSFTTNLGSFHTTRLSAVLSMHCIHTHVSLILGPTDPNFGRRYSKRIIVYYMCINLQSDFVRVASWIITNVLTKIGPEDQAKSKTINCRWADWLFWRAVGLQWNWYKITIIPYDYY